MTKHSLPDRNPAAQRPTDSGDRMTEPTRSESVATGVVLVLCRCCREGEGGHRLLIELPVVCRFCGEACSCEGCHAEQEVES